MEVRSRLHANNRKTLGTKCRVQRECKNPNAAKDASQLRLAIMQWEEKWKAMMSDLGGDAKTPDLWRVWALLEICPKHVEEHMMMRLDEIGENYEQTRGCADGGSGSEPEGKDGEDVDEVQGGSIKEKGKGGEKSKGHARATGKN